MLRVGLTGSIATGKSHVTSLLQQFGCHIIDADQVAREVVEPGQRAYHEIIDEFAPEILDPQGRIHRTRLGEMVFKDPIKRKRLNEIVHPRILEAIALKLSHHEETHPRGIAVVDGALIIEVGVKDLFDIILVVYCDAEEQLRRLMRRDGISREDAERRIAAQLSSEEKRRYADFEIDTSGPFEETRRQVDQVFRQLRRFASAPQGLAE